MNDQKKEFQKDTDFLIQEVQKPEVKEEEYKPVIIEDDNPETQHNSVNLGD